MPIVADLAGGEIGASRGRRKRLSMHCLPRPPLCHSFDRKRFYRDNFLVRLTDQAIDGVNISSEPTIVLFEALANLYKKKKADRIHR